MNRFIYFVPFLFFILSCHQGRQDSDQPLYRVSKGVVQKKIQFSGRVRSENSVLIRSPFDANLIRLDVSLGQKISANQSVAVLGKPENNNRISELIQKKGLLEQLEYKKQQLSLTIKNNNKELKRLGRLLAAGSISATERQRLKVQNALEKKEYKIVKSQITTTKREIKNLQKRERNSSKTLKSPISGTVTELWTEESNITPGMNVNKDTTIAVIEKFGRYVLKGTVSEPDYINIELGQEVEVQLAFVKDAQWTGTIKSLSPTSGGQSLGIGRFSVNVAFDADEKEIKTGLEGVGRIYLSKKDNVLRVPRSALLQEGDRFFVSYPTETGVGKLAVQVGVIGDLYAEVVQGLQEGNDIYKSYVSQL